MTSQSHSKPAKNHELIESSEIVFRRARRSDLEAIQQFIVRNYGATAPFKGPDRTKWQFIDNPFTPSEDADPTIWIAIEHDKVVGQIAVQDAIAYVRGDERLACGWIVDVMVDSAYRKRGIANQIHDCILGDRSMLVTLTMAPATRRIAERNNCVTLGPTRQLICPFGLTANTVRRWLRYKAATTSNASLRMSVTVFAESWFGPALIAMAGRSVAQARRFIHRRNAVLRNTSIEEITGFSADIDELWQRTRGGFDAIFERSSRFLNWRFCDCPGLRYRRFQLREGTKVRGYVVTRLANEPELRQGVIADLYAAPDDDEAVSMLINHAFNLLSPCCDYIEAAASSYQIIKAYQRTGFIATRTMRPTIVCKDPVLRARLATDKNAWHFNKADHDWDQVHPV